MIKELIVADPQDTNHKELFKNFNFNDENILNTLKTEPYQIKTILFKLKDNKISKGFYIEGYKDLKNCDIHLININEEKDTKLILEATEYATNYLNMNNIYLYLKNINKKLEKEGFETIENKNIIIMMKDNIEYQNKKGVKR